MPFSVSGLFELPQQYAATYERNMHRERGGGEGQGGRETDRQTDGQTDSSD